MTAARQIGAALDALRIRSATSYSWLGQLVEADRPGAAGAASWIERSLPARLYADFYLTGGPAPVSAPLAWRLDTGEVAAVAELSAANTGTGSPQPGWRVVAPDGDRVVVERDGLRLWARPEGLVPPGAAPGAEVALVGPKERLGHAEGFYVMMGDAGNAGAAAAIDRLYWHLRRDGAVPLVASASEVLNRAGVPFRLKVANNPRGFRRCDTAVLYTAREDRERVLGLALAIHARIAGHVHDAVPALTLRLGPGLAFAEDPGGGESYGASRTRLVAHGALAAWRAGEGDARARAARVEAAMAEARIDPRRPYLGPGSPFGPELAALAA